MRANIIYILIGLFLIGNMSIQTAAADPEYGVKIDMVAYVTPDDIEQNNYTVNVYIKAENLASWMYPLTMRYIYEGREISNITIESGYSSFSHVTWFKEDGAPNYVYKQSEVQLISRGSLIGLGDRYEPTYTFDRDQKEFDLQVVGVHLALMKKEGIFGFMNENLYKTKFTIKNLNQTYAFKGIVEVGDFGVMSRLKINRTGTIGPGMSVEIDGPIMNDKDIQDIRTEIRTCSFC